MTLREQLLSNKPKTQPIEINGTTYYLRDASVGDMNHIIFEQRQWLIKQAEIEGIELPDENGNRLFDPNNVDDLNAIAELDSQVFLAFSKATDAPKALASEESSS